VAERSIVYHLEKAYPGDTITTRLQGFSAKKGEEGEWIIECDPRTAFIFKQRPKLATSLQWSYLVAGKVEHALVAKPSHQRRVFHGK